MGSCEHAVFLSSCRRFQIIRKKYSNRLRSKAAEILTRDYKERKVVQDADLIQPSFACGCRSSSTPPSYQGPAVSTQVFLPGHELAGQVLELLRGGRTRLPSHRPGQPGLCLERGPCHVSRRGLGSLPPATQKVRRQTLERFGEFGDGVLRL